MAATSDFNVFGTLKRVFGLWFQKDGYRLKLTPTGSTLTADRTINLPNANADTTLLTTDGVQDVTNKDIDGGAASDDSRITLPKAGTSALNALTRKQATLWFNSDTNQPVVDNGSALIPIAGGGGSGEKTYITNPSGSNDVAGNVPTGWANVGDLDIVVTKTLAELPREYTTAAGLKITADTNVQSTADYVYFDFNLDDVDLNKKLKIQWSQKLFGAYASGSLAVVITSQADRTTTLYTPVTTLIPNADGVFTTSFDSANVAALSLVIRATGDMATDTGLVISDVIVGPGIQPQGAVVEGWSTARLFSPASGAFGTVSLETYSTYRLGSGMQCKGTFKCGTLGAAAAGIALPSGLTINSTALSNQSNAQIVGWWGIARAGASANLASSDRIGVVFYDGSTTGSVYLAYRCTSNAFTKDAGNALGNLANSDTISFELELPIAEWAGSGTVNLAQNDVEYAYNSSTSTSDDTTSFAYGPAGALIKDFAPSGLNKISKRVRFQTPIQIGDELLLQASPDGNKWIPMNLLVAGYSENDAGTTGYGFDVNPVNSTDVDVRFFSKLVPSTAWSVVNTYRWRVRKTSAGAAVSFGAATSDSSGLAPSGVFKVGLSKALSLQQAVATPSDPAISSEGQVYIKGNKLIIQFNDAGTVRYKYLDLTGTGVTWVHSTSAP